MSYPNHGTPAFVRRHPELPAFCRTRHRNRATVKLCKLRRLELLLWLVLTLQVSILSLVVSGLPVPPPVSTSASAASSVEQEQHLP
mgnify:CR=1 FL=1